jgi:hypothetical protein
MDTRQDKEKCLKDMLALVLEPDTRARLWGSMNDRNGEPEGGSEWEPIKILLEGDRDSNKMNTASNTRL